MSQVSICNVALSKIGDESILSLDDDTKAARYCKLLYDEQRKFVLRSYPWRFALNRYVLAPLRDKPLFGYEYQFSLPADCLRVWEVIGNSRDNPFQVENGRILYNQSVLKFIGISDVSDPSLFDAMFSEALSLRLASQLAFPLTADKALSREMTEQYEYYVQKARSASAFEGTNEQITLAESWLEARL